MARAALLTLLALFVGCRAPMPRINPLVPYGQTRVAPPSSSMGNPAYYNNAPAVPATPTTPGIGTGFRQSAEQTNRWSTIDDDLVVAGPQWSPSRAAAVGSGVAAPTLAPSDLTSNTAVTAPVVTAPVVMAPVAIAPTTMPRVISPPSLSLAGTSDAGATRLRGMPVNDATRLAEPGPFVPSPHVIDITQLPDARPAEPSVSNAVRPVSHEEPANRVVGVSDGWRSRSGVDESSPGTL